MFLLVSVRRVGAHPDEFQHGVSIESSISLGKTFPQISRIRDIPSTQILARVFVYLPSFISQILDFICRMVLIFFFGYILDGVTLKTSNWGHNNACVWRGKERRNLEARLLIKFSTWFERLPSFTSDEVGVGVVIRSVELMLKWKQPSDFSYLRLRRLRSAYDLVKTTLSEAEAEAEEPNQSGVGT